MKTHTFKLLLENHLSYIGVKLKSTLFSLPLFPNLIYQLIELKPNTQKIKLIKKSIFTVLLLLFCSIIFGQGLRSSHHDFSGASWSGNEYCKPCHTPHNANLEVPNSPLWNHQVTSSVFEMYTSPTLDGILGQPTGKTKLCLSCHDGTVAVDNHSGFKGGTTFVNLGNISTNLRNDHPVSLIYDSALAAVDGDLYDPSTTPSGLGSTIEEDLLENGRLECTSCHDVHISRNTQGCIGCHQIQAGGGMVTKTLSLWKSNDGSALCLTCHKK